MQRWLLLVLVVAVIILGLLIGVLNAQPASLDMLFFTTERSLGLLVTGAFVSGLLLGALAIWTLRVLPLRFRLKRALREQQAPLTVANSDSTDITSAS